MVKDHDIIQAVKDRNIPVLHKLLSKAGKSNKSKYSRQVVVAQVWIGSPSTFTGQTVIYDLLKFKILFYNDSMQRHHQVFYLSNIFLFYMLV